MRWVVSLFFVVLRIVEIKHVGASLGVYAPIREKDRKAFWESWGPSKACEVLAEDFHMVKFPKKHSREGGKLIAEIRRF